MPEDTNPRHNSQGAPRSSLLHPPAATFLAVGIWFGVATGLVEGFGLLLFQRINSARWGPMIHVSEEIIWISPLVDLGFFLLPALIVGVVGRLIPRLPAMRVLIFLLAFLSVYDWLTLTGRLYYRACLLLALGVAAAFSRWFHSHESAALQFWRRTVPWMLAALVLTGVGIQGSNWLREREAVAHLPTAAPGSPNVLVIVVDTLRADHLSSYGYARPTSPNLDRLAQQGVLFENALSTCSWSYPSHVSLLTGRYEFEHGLGKIGRMPLFGSGPGMGGYPTLGEALEQRGYRTGAFSANRTFFTRDLGFWRGFTHFEDYFQSPADMFVRTLFGREFARIYLTRSDKSKVKRAARALGLESLLDPDSEGSGPYGGAQAVRKRAPEVTRELLQWIDGDRRQHPFFAFLNYFDVHFPFGGPRSYPKPGWEQNTVIGQYDSGIKYVDDALAQLMSELGKRGLTQNTVVVITSDHGEALGQHAMTFHGRALYREQIHVPLIFWYPDHLPAGMRVPTPVTNAAIPATMMELLDPKATAEFPGPALPALWNGTQAGRNWPIPLSELAQNRYLGKEDASADRLVPTATTGPMKSLVTLRWHLITHKELGEQLYDWAADSSELNNLVSTPEGRTEASKLTSQLADILAKSAARPVVPHVSRP